MNLKIFMDGTVDKDWDIDTELSSLQHLYDEILFELKEYEDQTASDFVTLHDKTTYQILVVIKTFINKHQANSDVLRDLMKLSEQ